MLIALILVLLAVLTVKKRKKVSLRNYMAQFPRGLGGREAVSMLLPAAIELRNLHNNGKLHLQLSPDTILISSKGAMLKASGKRETDRLCPGFAAPEIYRGAGYGVASDLYSFAAIVLFAATGKIPPNSLQQDVLKARLAELAEEEPEFAAVLRNALAFQPQDRTQSMQELIYEISAFNTQMFRGLKPDREKAAEERKQREQADAAEKAAQKVAAAELAEKKEVEKAAREAAAAEQAQKKAEQKAAAAEKAKANAAEKVARKASAKQKSVNPRRAAVLSACAAAVCMSALLYVALPMIKYSRAESLMDEGRYEEAIAAFEALDGYQDSSQRIETCREGIRENAYAQAVALKEQEAYVEAYYAFEELGRDYKDCADQIEACKDASEEVTYLAAKALMEQRFFPAAKITLQKIANYKDSQSLLRICNEEIGLSKKEEALELIASIRPQEYSDATKYIKAIDLFLEADSLGVDCDAEIRQYEISMLDHPLLKKHSKLKPYVTRGEPVGRETRMHPTTRGGAVVYSMTRVDLDNGCVRFTVDCIPVKGVVGFSIFNPPDGKVFMFRGAVNPVSERQTIVFDILKEDVRKAGDMTIGFGDISPNGKGGLIYVRNLY